MKLYTQYVEHKIVESVKYGVNSATVNFDEVMKPSLFNEMNMLQLRDFIIQQVGLNCNLTYVNYVGGKRFTFVIYW